jgi:hypothetical protein
MVKLFAAIAIVMSAPAYGETLCDTVHWSLNSGAATYVDPDSVVESRSQDERLRFALELVKLTVPTCTEAEIGIDLSDRSKNHCQRVAKGEIFSEMCYLTGKYGYYFIHVNLMDQGVVIFNRWD